MYYKKLGRFHQRKFKKIAYKAIKTVKHGIIQGAKILTEMIVIYHQCLLHLISFRGLSDKTIAKTAYKT